MTGTTDQPKVTSAEVGEIFGEWLPIEAVTLLQGFEGTPDELRAQLREIAAKRDAVRSNEMVERVARKLCAIAVAGNDPDSSESFLPWDELGHVGRDQYRKEAREIMWEMREPTEAMLDAGNGTRALSVYSTWRIMLATALSEGR